MRQAGRYLPEYMALRKNASNFLDFCYTPKMAAEVTLQPVRRFDMDAAILFSDILVIPDALGQNVEFKPGEGPCLEPVRTVENFKLLTTNQVLEHLAPVFETIKLVRSELSDDKALIGFAGSPWTIACYMVEGKGSRDFETVRKLAAKEPELFENLLELITDATCVYLKAQIDAGVNAIQLFDSWSGVLDRTDFENFVIKPTQKIRAVLKDYAPNIPVIGFPRLCGANILDYVKHTNVDGVSLDHTVDPYWAANTIPENVVLQGNLDPVHLLTGGQGCFDRIDRICDAFKDRPFIFNLGHGVIKETPPEHVQNVIDYIRKKKG